MATIVNSGRDFFVYTLSLNQTTDTAFAIQTGYTPSTQTNGASYVPAQVLNANAIVIQCRTAVDLQLRKTAAASDFFTIKSGTVFEFKLNPTNTQNLFFLRSSTGSVTAEIIVYTE